MNIPLQGILNLPNVRRWHTRPVRRDQTLAEHSGMVALLFLFLAPPDLSIVDVEQGTRLSLCHDLHETVFGDIPYPARMALQEAGIDLDGHCQDRFWGCDIWFGVSDRVRALVEVADALEVAVFSRNDYPEKAEDIWSQTLTRAEVAFPDPGFDRDWVLLKVSEVLACLESR